MWTLNHWIISSIKNIGYMKKIALTFSMLLLALFVFAGNWNPYVKQGTIFPSPLVTYKLNGTGTVTFATGNGGSEPLVLRQNQEMILVISLSKCVPNNSNPESAIEGSWANMFNWSYNPAISTFTGIQNQDLPANSEGNLIIQIKVTANSERGAANNGVNINITPPAYSNGVNSTKDDAASVYTHTQDFPYYGIDPKDGSIPFLIYSFDNDIYVKENTGKELTGHMEVFDMTGKKVDTRNLKGGTLNQFMMTVDEGYYLVVVDNKGLTQQKTVFLTK
jgi:hypothetical protein